MKCPDCHGSKTIVNPNPSDLPTPSGPEEVNCGRCGGKGIVRRKSAKKRRPAKKKKFTLEFSPEATADLQRVTRQLGASSNAKVVRDALSLYVFLANQLGSGSRKQQLAIVDQDDVALKIITVPGLRQ